MHIFFMPFDVVVPPRPVEQDSLFGGTWNTTVSYNDGVTSYRDLYQIELFEDSTCIVSVRTQENGKEARQDGDGYWSYDDNFFRLECDFINPVISRLASLRWTSVYTLDSNNRRLVLLVNPAPGVKNTVRAVLTRGRQ
jgi:hypothetical protein